VGIFAAFFVVGLWHGSEWRFIAWGVLQAAGLIVNHYYTVWLKRRLGPEKYRRYNENRWINAAAQAATFCFVAASLFVFANDNFLLGSVFSSVLGLSMGKR
jgi:D-alanyl-lipoteichoic acid acyltransferase DltB (MBOAT superfamily)